MIPLKSRLTNGATVSDWLGTAGVACTTASSKIDLIRQELVHDEDYFRQILEALEQARLEIVAVQSHVANENLKRIPA